LATIQELKLKLAARDMGVEMLKAARDKEVEMLKAAG
tara:strand:+ start:578 stop:688 length:111 start_codon:yes stop_codon:yes gene_type:complete